MNSLKVWLANDMSWFTMPTVSITITDVLEIFILAFLVYSLLLWIKYQSVDTSQGTYGVGGMRITGLYSAHGYPDFYRESGN